MTSHTGTSPAAATSVRCSSAERKCNDKSGTQQLTLQFHGRLDSVCDKPGRIFRADSSLYYVLKYPPSSSESAIADTHEGAPRPNIAGAFVLCPMVDVSPESRPSALIEYIAKGIKYFAGSLPLAKAVRGNVSDDPRVEADFFSDRELANGLP